MTEMEARRAEMAQERSENQKDRAHKSRENRKDRDNKLRQAVITAGAKLLGSSNHPIWYNKNSALVRDAANISFSTPLGSTSNGPAGNIGGIMVFYTHPVLPKSVNAANPDFVAGEVLQAFRSQYAQIRKANSGAKNYEFTDIAKYNLAIDSVYSALADARRVYGLLRKFDAHNRFVGDQLIKSLGWDPENLRANSAQFRERINYYQKMISSFASPSINTVVDRQTWMFSNIFKDSNLNRSQLYAYRLSTVYVLDDSEITDPENYRMLRAVAWTKNDIQTFAIANGFKTLTGTDGFIDQMDKMVTALLNDPYSAIISGDIMKAYGDKAVAMYFPDLPVDFDIPFTYSEDTLTQIAGIQTIGTDKDKSDAVFDLRQVSVTGTGETVLTQLLPYKYTRQATYEGGDYYSLPYMINSYKEQVTPDEVMVATRMGVISKLALDSTHALHFYVATCGTEVVSKIEATVFDIQTGAFRKASYSTILSAAPARSDLPVLLQFDWRPQICVLASYTSEDFKHLLSSFRGFLNDIHNFAFIDEQVLSRLHEVAATSLYGLITQ